MIVPLERMGELARHLDVELENAYVGRHHELVAAAQRRLTGRAPRLTGNFAASITPTGAAGPGVALAHVERRAPQGGAEVAEALRGWRPGQPSGHATAHGGAVRLASGSSRQARNGWMWAAVRAAVASVGDEG